MVVIECPHCDEEIEMEDDAHGLFECPYCGGEYEWGEAPKNKNKGKSRFEFKSSMSRFSRSSSPTKSAPVKEIEMGYSPVSFGKLVTSTVLLFIVLVGINSNSWYGYSYDVDDVEIEVNYGLDLQENIMTNDEATTGNWDQTDTYTSMSGSMTSYDTNLKQAELQKEWIVDYCSDSNNAWGETEEEFDARCDEMKISADETIDWWNSWDTAGTFLFFFLICSLFLLLGLIVMNCAALLNHLDWVDSNEILMTNFRKTENIVGMVTYTLIMFGLLMFWIFIPSLDDLWDINDTSAPSGLSSGLGFIWWSTLITSIICLATTSVAATRKS